MEISDSLEEEEALEVSHSLDQEEKLELSSSTKKEKRPEEADAPYIYGKRKHQSTRYPREGVNLRRPSRGGDRKEHPAAEKIFNQYQRTFPFDDKEITKCVKIEPKDIRLYQRRCGRLVITAFFFMDFIAITILFLQSKWMEATVVISSVCLEFTIIGNVLWPKCLDLRISNLFVKEN